MGPLCWPVVLTLPGRTLSVRVMKDERGQSRGFGFVNFAHHDDAQKVLCGVPFVGVEQSYKLSGTLWGLTFPNHSCFPRQWMKWTERSSTGKWFTLVGRRSGWSARGSSSASLSWSNRIEFSATRCCVRAHRFIQDLKCPPLTGLCFHWLGCESVCEEPGWRHRWWKAAEGVCALRHHHQRKGSSELVNELLMES